MIVLDFIRQQMPNGWKQTPSGWISGNCPMCSTRGHSPDKRGRGGIRFEDNSFQYNCFNCGFKTGWSDNRRISGKLADLLKVFGTDESDIQRINFEILREQEANDIAGNSSSETRIVNVEDSVLPSLELIGDSVDFILKEPPVVIQIKEAIKLKKGSPEPNRNKVGKLTWEQVEEIAKGKMSDLNAFTVPSAMKMVAGTARSMGVTISGDFPY